MTGDLIERLRETLPGIAQEECRGDNLAILLASYFEPGIEDDELDDSGTWKQGAIDASNRVLDAIHAHYATALATEREAREKAERKVQAFRDDGLVQAAIARQGALQDERDEALASLAEARRLLTIAYAEKGYFPGLLMDDLRRFLAQESER